MHLVKEGEELSSQSVKDLRQFSTFYVADRLYGIEVTEVQEVTRPMPITKIRLAPDFVKGLINLRGQISTAIGLQELFLLNDTEGVEKMTVVCRFDGNLLSFLVDRIGDVIEVSRRDFEAAPDTVEPKIRSFMEGVYKTSGSLLSVISVEKIYNELNKENQSARD